MVVVASVEPSSLAVPPTTPRPLHRAGATDRGLLGPILNKTPDSNYRGAEGWGISHISFDVCLEFNSDLDFICQGKISLTHTKPLKLEIVEYNETRITDKKAAGRWANCPYTVPHESNQQMSVPTNCVGLGHPSLGSARAVSSACLGGEGQRPRGTRELLTPGLSKYHGAEKSPCFPRREPRHGGRCSLLPAWPPHLCLFTLS